MNNKFRYKNLVIWSILLVCVSACNKIVEIPAPINSITASKVFNSDNDATSAVTAIYSNMSLGSTGTHSALAFSNGGTTIYAGLSADDLTDYDPSSDEFVTNSLVSNNVIPYSIFWQPAYFDIYMANAVIDNLQNSKNITPQTKTQLIGESKFLRAFCYFYLVNLYGGVPLVLSTDFHQTALLPRASPDEIYSQITADLNDAQKSLSSDFAFSNGEPTRATKWAALAMLARVNLYLKKWSAADSAATAVINSGQFSLVPLPMVPEFPPNVNPDSDAFSANSVEAILQFETVNVRPWATAEGDAIEPSRAGGFPGFILENSVINGFESNDLRRSAWVDSIVFNGATYYYPTKYKVWRGASGNITEYYMVLRFAEQYLVRAEAEANGAGGGPGSAIADLNIIRTRAGLSPLSDTTGDISSAIKQEWRNEFFAEWGHRWLDLKRWGMALSTLDTIPIKGSNINNNQLLYPIPLTEIQDDPNLIQNPGYTSH